MGWTSNSGAQPNRRRRIRQRPTLGTTPSKDLDRRDRPPRCNPPADPGSGDQPKTGVREPGAGQGCRSDFHFPVLKLWDYNERWSELEASDNPFAAAVMVHLKTRATRKDGKGRLRWKLQMVRHLYERGFERREVERLFRFIDWLMVLPEELEEQFDVELRQLEGETKMPYVTRFERRAIERGRNEGRNEGIQLEKASRDELEHWADRVIDAESLEQVFAAG